MFIFRRGITGMMILLIVWIVFLAGPVSSNAFAQEAVEADPV